MNEKPTVVFVGGLSFNIPKKLRERFEIVKHVQQRTTKVGSIPKADWVFILVDFVSHRLDATFQMLAERAGIPCVKLNRGWASMYGELVRAGAIIEEAPKPVALPAPVESTSETVIGLPPDELWDTYGDKAIEALRSILKPGEPLQESELLEWLGRPEATGLPASDLKWLLPELAMRGIIQAVKGLWALTSPRDGVTVQVLENDPDDEPLPALKPLKPKREKKTPFLDAAIMIAGLPAGPYSTWASMALVMNRYVEFRRAGTSLYANSTQFQRIATAQKLGVIVKENGYWVVKRDPAVRLTKYQERPHA